MFVIWRTWLHSETPDAYTPNNVWLIDVLNSNWIGFILIFIYDRIFNRRFVRNSLNSFSCRLVYIVWHNFFYAYCVKHSFVCANWINVVTMQLANSCCYYYCCDKFYYIAGLGESWGFLWETIAFYLMMEYGERNSNKKLTLKVMWKLGWCWLWNRWCVVKWWRSLWHRNYGLELLFAFYRQETS